MKRLRKRTRKGAPGIIEVANRAGVSPATVSRFYNNPDVVRGPTRKRIEKAAQDLGYIRDRMAGTLHNRFSGTFGLIVPTIDNAIFAELIDAFSSRLQQCDRTMLIATHGYDLGLESGIVRSLLERRIDGIALIGFDHNEVPLNMLEQRDVPVISIWNHDANSAIPSVGADNKLAGNLVADHILELGHTEIALIFPDTTNNDRARDRLTGVQEVLLEAGIEVDAERNLRSFYDVGEAKSVACKLLQEKNPPSAIICGNDVIAHGVVYAAQKLKIDIPQKLSVVGIGDFTGSEYLEPGLTTVRMPAKRIGIQAANTILAMSETGLPPQPFHNPIPLELVIRNSTQSKS
ncbi:MAG: LacI family DNA-binding transcriptional regulator [Pseudomonadota bacterium]